MGMNTYIPGSSSFENRDKAYKDAKYSTHRARVTDIHVAEGTVSVTLEDIAYQGKVTMPLLGLSAPIQSDGNADFGKASWGRYIPQIGDLLYVAFSTTNTLYSLGYASIYYKGFEDQDKFKESEGGIGWGATSGVDIQPGDWDFRSGRRSTLYLGEIARIGALNCSSTYNYTTGEAFTTAPTIKNESSLNTYRFGQAKRIILPSDPKEQYIVSTRAGTTAQEFNVQLKWSGIPTALDLATFAFGDVIEEVAGSYAIRLSSKGGTTRRYFASSNELGTSTTYEEAVDSFGNYKVTSSLSTNFEWDTPLATWEITNLVSKLKSTTSIGLESVLVNLGNGSKEPLVKGTTFMTAYTAYLTQELASYNTLLTASVGPLAGYAPSFTALIANTSTLLSKLSTMLTTNTKAS
jgi:hypothetical protein